LKPFSGSRIGYHLPSLNVGKVPFGSCDSPFQEIGPGGSAKEFVIVVEFQGQQVQPFQQGSVARVPGAQIGEKAQEPLLPAGVVRIAQLKAESEGGVAVMRDFSGNRPESTPG